MLIGRIKNWIKEYRNAHKLIKWKKVYSLTSLVLMIVSFSITVYAFYYSYSNSAAIYEDIQIDPDSNAVIALNFTQLDQMRVDIPFHIQNYHNFFWIRDISYYI